MLVGTEKRKNRNSTRVNLVLSATFHGLIVAGLIYFAAREGYLGKTIKTISIDMVKSEKPKPPDKPKEPAKPNVDEPKAVEPKIQEIAKIETAPKPNAPAPPSAVAPPAFAPPPPDMPSFDFEGGRPVLTSTDPVQLYKGLLETALRFNWDRPRDADDHTNVAEVEVAVDKAGAVTSPVWKKKSGQTQWDESVSAAIASTKKLSLPPPSNFPTRVVVRFDVEALTPVGQE
jgi:hypothetical protein